MTQAYPLQWPKARPRKTARKSANFGKKVRESGRSYDTHKALSIADAVQRLQDEIDRIGARDYVLSTNIQVRLDGWPRSDAAQPRDPGACLYFTLGGKPHALPCDTYDRVADNIAAIAKHIEATRAIERYGVATMEELFTGFTALPAPKGKSWREVLGLQNVAGGAGRTRDDIETQYRLLAKSRHPDAPGGSHEAMAELNAARDAALQEVGP